MIALEPPFRLARPADGAVLARLVNEAGEGLPLAIWQGLAAAGDDPWEIGARRQTARAAEGQIVALDEGAGAVAALTGYRIDTARPIGADMPAQFRPLQALENRAVPSWYVNVLATLAAHRGRGLGRSLLALAARIARAEGLGRLSLIVAGHNDGARRLYAREGFVEIAREPMVGGGRAPTGRDWILMLKDLATTGGATASGEPTRDGA